MKLTLGRTLVGGAVLAAAVLIPTQAASAHDTMLESTPANGETVSTLDEVALTFSGELIDFGQASFAQVEGPDGLYYETACSTIERNVLSTPVELGEAGTYTVTWNAVSSDGHPVSEAFDFDYEPVSGGTPALGWDLPACDNEDERVQPGSDDVDQEETTAPDAETPEEAAPIPTTEAPRNGAQESQEEASADTGTGMGGLFVFAGFIVVLILIALVFVLRSYTKSRRDAGDDPDEE
ncbi:copper resistance protein CopC [Microbacterium nanhaiense]|uniref:Copper resistance protein CopC n=1 Tax=Microbacterium nanhaiense TaxID=1301026 RepID=A0ABQ2MXR6_9MICO|nr:copper resistance protein CopC [Microbacterium nanhaiense]GGO59775.1 copper resistance protein CopC [Microbacterium nanhaiense]